MFALAVPVAGAAVTPILSPGHTIAARLAGRQTISYRVRLLAGQCFRAILDQHDEDLVAAMLTPAGKTVERFNGFDSGQEPIWFIAPATGVYKLVVRCVEQCESVVFQLKVLDDAIAQPEDEARVQAIRAGNSGNFGEAAELWEHLGEAHFVVASLIQKGEVQHNSSDYKGACESLGAALRLSAEIHDPEEPYILNDAAMCTWRLGSADEALSLLNQALGEWRKLPTRTVGEAKTLSNQGLLYGQTGEHHKSIACYRKAISIARRLGKVVSEALSTNNLALAYLALGNVDSASRFLERSAVLFRAAGDKPRLGGALMNLGFLRLQQGRTLEARKAEEDAFALIKESKEPRAMADVLNDLGRVADAQGKPNEALDYYRQALKKYETAGYRRGVGSAMHNLGRALAAAGNQEEALSVLKDAYGRLLEVGFVDGMTATLCRIASVELERDPEDAYRRTEEAMKMIESVRGRVTSGGLRESYFATQQSCYETAIDSLMRLHAARPEEGRDILAFETAERGRARGLLDSIAEHRSDIRKGASVEMLARERTIHRNLSAQAEQIARMESPAQVQAAREGFDSLVREYELLEGEMREQNPRYAALVHPQPYGVRAIQEQLDPDTVLLEYALGDRKSYMWAVTARGVKAVELPGRAAIEANAEIVARNAAERRSAGGREAAALSAQLFSGVAELIVGKRMLIVTEGKLLNTPYASLPCPGKEKGRLGFRHEIVNLPSASALVMLRQSDTRRPELQKRIAILADPVFDSDDPRVKRRIASGGTHHLNRLVFSRREAKAIEKLVPADERKVALDFRADKAMLAGPAMANYKIIHIASHAVVDLQRPELSGIALSQVNEQGQPRDGWVRLYDIYNLNLPSELVVLSACRTASGKQVRGEGLVGMTRAFLFAGTRRVLVSLWQVDDESTAELMQRFYRKLWGSPPVRPAAALRMAQEDLAKQQRWRDPYYWAGFEMVGDW